MSSSPSLKTLKILFAQSGNRCAAPGCKNPIVAQETSFDHAAVVGNVAHIVARNPNGPRGVRGFPKDQLHDESNLILLCAHHHSVVDAQDSTYTVDELHGWKLALRNGGSTTVASDYETQLAADFNIAKNLLRERRFEAAGERLQELIARADAGNATLWSIRARLKLVWWHIDERKLSDAEKLLHESDELLKSRQATPDLHASATRARCRVQILQGEPRAIEEDLAALASRDPPGEDVRLAEQILRAGLDLAMLHIGFENHAEAHEWLRRVDNNLSCLAADGRARELVEAVATEVRLRLAIEDSDCTAVAAITESWGGSCSRTDAADHADALLHYANFARHAKQYKCGIHCATGAAAAARTAGLAELAGAAEQTSATLLCLSGNAEEGLRLNSRVLRQVEAAGHNMVAVAARLLAADLALQNLDGNEARAHAEAALAESGGDEISAVLSHRCLAEACWLVGDAARAREHVDQALHLGKMLGMPDGERRRLLSRAVDVVGQYGLWDEANRYLTEWEHLEAGSESTREDRDAAQQRVGSYRKLHAIFQSLTPAAQPVVMAESLPASLAQVVRPVCDWWDDLGRATPDLLDYWGRGNFIQALQVIANYPRGCVLVVEARTRRDIELTVRLCGLLADVILVLWKGECCEGRMLSLAPLHHDGAGGAGYMLAAGARLGGNHQGTWVPALASGRYLPEEVIDLLGGDGRSWFESGRLLVVPAWSAGCLSPAFGPLEQLLTETLRGLAVVRSGSRASGPWRLLPWFPEVPLGDLQQIAIDPEFNRPRLRQLLIERSRTLATIAEAPAQAELEQEIEAELQELDDGVERHRRHYDWTVAHESWATDRVSTPGGAPAETTPSKSPWTPFLRIGQLGYRWQVDHIAAVLSDSSPDAEARASFDGAGEWLAPEDMRPLIPMVRHL